MTEPGPDEIEAAYQQALASLEEAEECAHDAFDQLATTPIASEPESEPLGLNVGQATTEPEETAEPAQLEEEERPVDRTQVIEALLFVGGSPLTSKKLASLLGGNNKPKQVEQAIEEMNQRYQSEGRPYEIRLIEGGYVLDLAPEFEGVRGRVFGHGPREIKLSQDVLEVLSVIAYRGPLSRKQIDEATAGNRGAAVRQLLRRELIELDRAENEDRYRTTPRFLELFGLRNLDDLPQVEMLSLK